MNKTGNFVLSFGNWETLHLVHGNLDVDRGKRARSDRVLVVRRKRGGTMKSPCTVYVHSERGRDGIILNKWWGVVRADIVTEFRRRFSDAPQAAYRFGARNPGKEETKDDPQ